MTRICFVTDELYPANPGGAGMLLFNSGLELTKRGHEISFLLDMNLKDYAAAKAHYLSSATAFQVTAMGHVEELCANEPIATEDSFGGYRAWRSWRISVALEAFCKLNAFDAIEFNDFYGPAYFSLVNKACGVSFKNISIAIRTHNTTEVLAQAGDATAIDAGLLEMWAMERASLRRAEHILTPSLGYWDLMQAYYAIPLHGEVLVSSPALHRWPQLQLSSDGRTTNYILYYGRLQPFKGLDLLIGAITAFLGRFPEARFIAVGGESSLPGPGLSSYREQLLRLIPSELISRIEFTGPLDFAQLEQRLPFVRFAIFPNYFESYCYAAHELRAAGIPLLLSETPAFTSAFSGNSDVSFFDGTVKDLLRQFQHMWNATNASVTPKELEKLSDFCLQSFYDAPPVELPKKLGLSIDISILILCDNWNDAQGAYNNLMTQLRPADRCILLSKVSSGTGHVPIRFLGEVYYLYDPAGSALSADSALCGDAVLLLNAGDSLKPHALDGLRYVLETHAELSYVHCWRTITGINGVEQPYCKCIDMELEWLLFDQMPIVSRTLFRVPRECRVDDIFDLRAGRLGELDLLWKLDASSGGLTIPRILMSCVNNGRSFVPVRDAAASCSYLILKEQHRGRLKTLASMSLLGGYREVDGGDCVTNLTDSIALKRMNREQLKKYAARTLRIEDMVSIVFRRLQAFFALQIERMLKRR